MPKASRQRSNSSTTDSPAETRRVTFTVVDRNVIAVVPMDDAAEDWLHRYIRKRLRYEDTGSIINAYGGTGFASSFLVMDKLHRAARLDGIESDDGGVNWNAVNW
jgi:hypothetical protein